MAAQAWWNDDWSYRKQLTLDTTVTGLGIVSSPEEVPLLIRLHSGNFGYFLDMKQDGSDIRFVAGDDKTPLTYHIETFDPINELALIWVKVPRLAGNTNLEKIWMYYGSPDVGAGDDGPASFDVNQVLVYHFDGNGQVQDQTAYGNHPLQNLGEAIPAALIGAGTRFNGAGPLLIPDSPSLRLLPDAGWTFNAWVKIPAHQSDAYLLERIGDTGSLVIGIDGTRAYISLKDGSGSTQRISAAKELGTGTWYHTAATFKQGHAVLYVDGEVVGADDVSISEIGGSIAIGGSRAGGKVLLADVDEIQISNVARSADWIKVSAGGPAFGSTLIVYGEDEQNEGAGPGHSYFRTTLQNVTLDGWVVIGFLAVMSAISWVVMFAKGFVISRTARQNNKFLNHFRNEAAENPAILDADESPEEEEIELSPMLVAMTGKHGHFQGSSIYRLYHAGIQELKHRVGSAVGAQVSTMTPQTIDAIRATLDAVMVRESQKLNKQMVLLTIAISGGPFLGLLGTVVGVMITFAAIAASGDVDVNAIAPGIAAALVATVAGLAVAIPALFGYNYLGSRIKDILADMHVFVDEFVTKLAEHYS